MWTFTNITPARLELYKHPCNNPIIVHIQDHFIFKASYNSFNILMAFAQSAGAIEYTDSISAEG